MGTAWQKVICESAMTFIDDIRLQEEMTTDSALFFRRMSLYMNLAIPMLNRPPELLVFLKTGLVTPTYDDAEWTSDAASLTGQTVVSTGKTGYAIFSCVRQIRDGQTVIHIPYNAAVYDAETGSVTFPQQTEEGAVYLMDFYNDGSFAQDLSETLIRLLGMACACVWDDRFSGEWLANHAKIHDESFNAPNEGNYMTATTRKRDSNRMQFNGELRKYEQDVQYRSVVSAAGRSRVLSFL